MDVLCTMYIQHKNSSTTRTYYAGLPQCTVAREIFLGIACCGRLPYSTALASAGKCHELSIYPCCPMYVHAVGSQRGTGPTRPSRAASGGRIEVGRADMVGPVPRLLLLGPLRSLYRALVP